MATDFDIDLVGLDRVGDGLRELGRSLAHPRPLWGDLEALFRSWVGEQFDREGGWGGTAWAPLSPAYAARKAARNPGRSLLIAEGELERAAQRPRVEDRGDTLVLSIDHELARIHAAGSSDLPARPLIPARLPIGAERDVERQGDEFVRERIRRSSL